MESLDLINSLIENGILTIDNENGKLIIDLNSLIQDKKKESNTKKIKKENIYISSSDNTNLNNNINLNRKEKLDKDKEKEREKERKENEIEFEMNDVCEKIKKLYKDYGYGEKWHKTSTFKKLYKVFTNGHRTLRLNPNQVVFAYAYYLGEQYARGTEPQYIKGSEIFLTNAVYDYAVITQESYESKMLEKYGDNWKKVKFIVKE